MSKLVYVTEEFLNSYKVNFDEYYPYYISGEFEKIDEIFHENYIAIPGNDYNIKSLLIEKEGLDYGEVLRENSKIIYETFKDITLTQANDERMWIAMYHKYYQEHLIDYIRKREGSRTLNKNLRSAIFFESGRRRSLIVHKLSQLWWLSHYLYDETKDNPYYYLEFLTSSTDLIGNLTMLFSRSFTSNKELLLGILDGYIELIDSGLMEFKRSNLNEILKYCSEIGAIQILDFLDRDDAKTLVYEYMRINQE